MLFQALDNSLAQRLQARVSGVSYKPKDYTEKYTDLVQELYMSQLKSYKAPAQPADAHVGHVKAFKQPAAPSAPSAPSDLAGELSTYESAQPSFTQQTQATGEAPKAEESADEFLSLLEADLPKPEVHH